MLIKSGLVTQASGSLGGMTASHNRGGMYLRARSIPVDPSTAQQTAVRNALATLTSRWQTTLTDAQRTAWGTYATNVPILNRVGESKPLTGIAMYTRCNVPLFQAGINIVDDGPTSFTLGDPPVLAGISGSADPTDYGPEGTIDAVDNPWASDNNASLLVYASRERAPTRQFFKGPFQYAGAVAGNSTTPPAAFAVSSPFGGSAGNIFTLQCRVAYADGRLSSAVRYTGTIS